MRDLRLRARMTATVISICLPLILIQTAYADPAGVSNVNNFIKSVIQVLAGFAGLIATGFFVVGGFKYIVSSGNPERLDKAKRTIVYSAIGLSIIIAAFVVSNIVTTLATNAFGS